jgi:hypothetical protein
MDPEPVPCVDRLGDEPLPTQVGAGYALGGSCSSQFSADRCQALGFGAAEQLHLGFAQVVALDVVPDPDPPPGGFDFAHRTFLKVSLADGNRQDVTISCPGIAGAYDPPCMPEPMVPVGSPGQAGYYDTPDGSTPIPSLEPAAVKAALPLRIPRLTIAVTAAGPQEIVLGRATLPNGYLSFTDLKLEDPWPSNVLFRGGVEMVVTPASGGEPLQNVYETGWHRGTVDVVVSLKFEVAWFLPGATFTIVDVKVR